MWILKRLAQEECCSIPITERPPDQGRLCTEHEHEATSSIQSQFPSSMAQSPKDFEHKIREERRQNTEEESIC